MGRLEIELVQAMFPRFQKLPVWQWGVKTLPSKMGMEWWLTTACLTGFQLWKDKCLADISSYAEYLIISLVARY